MEKIARPVVSVKRVKCVSFEDVDDALIIWFRQMSAQPNIRLDGEMLLLRACKFSADLGYDDAETLPMHWIDRFKVRWGIGIVAPSHTYVSRPCTTSSFTPQSS